MSGRSHRTLLVAAQRAASAAEEVSATLRRPAFGGAAGSASRWHCSWYRGARWWYSGPNAGTTHLLPVGAAPFRCRITVSGSQFGTCAGAIGQRARPGWTSSASSVRCCPGRRARRHVHRTPDIGIVARILKIVRSRRASLLTASRNCRCHRASAARRSNVGGGLPRGGTPPGALSAGDDAGRPAARAGSGARIAVVGLSIRRCSRPQSTGRPVQLLSSTYHHVDGAAAPAFVGDDLGAVGFAGC